MTFPSAVRNTPLLLLACFLLAGCDAFLGGDTDDSKNALLAKARTQREQYDYAGAVALYEKALEANPRLLRAHWELGLVSADSTKDYAKAIYHLQRLLELQPDWKQADDARRIIGSCKLELAKSAPFGPDTPEGQKLISAIMPRLHAVSAQVRTQETIIAGLTLTNNQLLWLNLQLREQLQKLQTSQSAPPAARPPAIGGGTVPSPVPPLPNTLSASPPPPAPATIAKPAPRPVAPRTPTPTPKPATATAPSGRTYQIKSGDTLASICSRYKVTIQALQKANPQFNPKRIEAGMVLRIPSR